jgi:hypothetical protein
MINTMHVDLIMHVSNTLSDLPKEMSEDELFISMWSHVNSKFSNEFDLNILKEKTDDPGIICLVSTNGDVLVDFFNLKAKKYRIARLENKKYKNFERFVIKEGDVLMFPSYIEHIIIGDGAKYINFKTDQKNGLTSDKNKYRVEVTFSDTYYIIVNADSEEDAKDVADNISISNFIHEWPKDPGLDRVQIARATRWGKKMLKAIKIEQ